VGVGGRNCLEMNLGAQVILWKDYHPTPPTSFSPIGFPFFLDFKIWNAFFEVFFALNMNFGMYFLKFSKNLN
jgi:hypothetical protein